MADAVRAALLEDASTTSLQLDVAVVGGIVQLRGSVADLEDAENAEAVASEVPGVREVADETTVDNM